MGEPNKLSNENRMELALHQSKIEAAELRLENARLAMNAAAKRVTDAYGIGPQDSINLETGEIKRVAKPVEPEADPAPAE